MINNVIVISLSSGNILKVLRLSKSLYPYNGLESLHHNVLISGLRFCT